jgi:hypothetical protein
MTTSESPPEASGPQSPTDSFEFTPEQNALFATLGTKMQFVGIFALGLGLVAVLLGLSHRDSGPILAGVLYGIIGLWTAHAGSQFRFVSWTNSHDISHLMAALRDLRKMYTLQYWICLIALVAALVLLGTSAVH